MFKIAEDLVGTGVQASNRRYDRLCELTKKLCHMEQIPQILLESNNWKVLYSFWELYFYELGVCDVFEAVIQQIYCGRFYYLEESEELSEIISLMQEELCSHEGGYIAWEEITDFSTREKIQMVTDEIGPNGGATNCHSKTHHLYLKSRTLCELLGLHKLDDYTELQNDIQVFEKAVSLLLPETKQWEVDIWLDEMNITNAIFKKYGIDYSQYWDDYNSLVALVTAYKKDAITIGFLRSVYAISNLPMSIAHVLWPENTVEKLTYLFLVLYDAVCECNDENSRARNSSNQGKNRYCHCFEMDYFKDCWLYKQINEWTENGSIDLVANKQIKQALFNISMQS